MSRPSVRLTLDDMTLSAVEDALSLAITYTDAESLTESELYDYNLVKVFLERVSAVRARIDPLVWSA